MLLEYTVKNTRRTENGYKLCFDMSWQEAFCDETNCDGVYIFARYKRAGEYGYLPAPPTFFSSGDFDRTDKLPREFSLGVSSIKTGGYAPADKLGIFIFTAQSCRRAELCITDAEIEVSTDGEAEDIVLFAVEMVYIPSGGHFIGDPENGISKGGKLKNCYYSYPTGGAYLVGSEGEIRFAPEEGCLYCDYDTPNSRQEDDRFIIPESFPKGYDSMWYMKHSLTEGQYVRFLNCLTRPQQQSHVLSDISGDRIDSYYVMTGTSHERDRAAIVCRRSGNGTEAPVKFFAAAENRSVNGISYNDVSAFACFAGLRPITELEFEKAARGPLPAVAGEFAWGTTNIGRVFHFDGVDGSGTEKPVSQTAGAICNCNFGTGIAPFDAGKRTEPENPGWEGPISAGLFQRGELVDGFSERECTGASYYGVMELCGNVWENLVTPMRESGRQYDGAHGSGILDENGMHTMPTWPSALTGEGVGVRGGVFVSPDPGYIHMALRVFGAHTKPDKRFHGGLRVGF